MKVRAISLIETVWALFIVTSCMLLVAGMVNLGIQGNARAARMQSATLLANHHLASVRSWAASSSNFATDWSGIHRNARDGEFLVNITSQRIDLYSPSSALELDWPPAQRRFFARSARRVEVRVSWELSTTSNVCLYTLIAAPADRTLASLAIVPAGPAPSPLRHGQQARFKVEARDSAGALVDDLFYRWRTVPRTSAGSLPPDQQVRSGAEATFQNFYRQDLFTGTSIYGPDGTADLAVSAKLAGSAASATQSLILQDAP